MTLNASPATRARLSLQREAAGERGVLDARQVRPGVPVPDHPEPSGGRRPHEPGQQRVVSDSDQGMRAQHDDLQPIRRREREAFGGELRAGVLVDGAHGQGRRFRQALPVAVLAADARRRDVDEPPHPCLDGRFQQRGGRGDVSPLEIFPASPRRGQCSAQWITAS